MPYSLCLFDLDGTLTDPGIGITKSFQYALASFGIHKELEDLTRFIGPPLRESFRDTYGFSDSDTEKAVVKFREYFADTGIFENSVYPDIPELLQMLKDSGRILAVVTSKAAIYAKRILEYFDLDKYFSYISGDEMDGSLTKNGKQDLIRIAINVLDQEREMSAVMIGDREHDIFGACGVGIDSIGNTWGYGPSDELKLAGATHIVNSTEELFRLITGVGTK